MIKKIFPFFSYLFHPIFISVFAALGYFLTVTDRYFIYENIYLYIIQILLLTVFIPLSCFYLLVMLCKIKSIMVADVNQRKIPLLLHIFLLLVLILKSITLHNIPELYFFYLGSIISSIIALILVFFNKKISLHMLGIAGLTVFYISICIHFQVKNVLIITILLLCNGLVGSSRLYMKAHTINELVMGYLAGAVPQIILLYYWLL